MIDISYNEEENLIQIIRLGDIYARDLIAYMNKIAEDYTEHPKLFILDDTRQSVSKFDHRGDYDAAIQVLKNHMHKFEQVHVALVADSPATTALSDLYKVMTANIRNYHYKMFSSREAARNWLKMSM